MKKNVIRIVGLVLVAAMMFAFASCGADNQGDNVILVSFVYDNGQSGGSTGGDTNGGSDTPTPTPTAAPVTQAPVDTPTEAPTAGGDTPTEAPTSGGTTPTEAPTAGGTTPTEAPAGDNLPKDAASILKKYTEVMDQLKTDKPGFNKKEFQEVPKEHLQVGSIGGIISPIIDSFMTKEADAEEQTHEKGNELKWVPVNENTKGCLLTDASKIKSATCEKDGTNWKITLTLVDEVDPEPTPAGTNAPVSFHGAVFNPISRNSITKELDGIKVVTVNRFNLKYHDCVATLVFNPENNHVVSLKQIMNIDIDANVKAAIITLDVKGLVINNMSMYNFVY